MSQDILEKIYDKLVEHDKCFEGINSTLAKHDKRFENLDTKLEEHDKRFENVDAKLVEHDKRFDRMEAKQLVHDTRLEKQDVRHDKHDARFDRIEAELHRLGVLHEATDDKIDRILEVIEHNFRRIFPREEIEEKFAQHDNRISAVESVLRKQPNK